MTTNPWKSVQRALTALTRSGKAKLAKIKFKASGKSLPAPNEWKRWRSKIPSRFSEQFRSAPLRTPGRRATRWLDDDAVTRAKIKSEDPKHQAKFLPRWRVIF